MFPSFAILRHIPTRSFGSPRARTGSTYSARLAIGALAAASCGLLSMTSGASAAPRAQVPLAASVNMAASPFQAVTATTPGGAILAVAVPKDWAATEVASSAAFTKARPETKPVIEKLKASGGLLFAIGPEPKKATTFRASMTANVIPLGGKKVTVADIVSQNASDKPFRTRRLTLKGRPAVRFDYARTSAGSGGSTLKSVRTSLWVIAEDEVILVALALPARDDALSDALVGSIILL